jgi:hypothetical protein
VADAIIDYMKAPRSKTELQLCAQVLHKNDSLAITFERIRLATESAKADDSFEQRDVFLGNLVQVKKWLSDPKFAEEKQYWPTMQFLPK